MLLRCLWCLVLVVQVLMALVLMVLGAELTAAGRSASGRPLITSSSYLLVTVKPCWLPYSTSDFCQAWRPAFRSLLAAYA